MNERHWDRWMGLGSGARSLLGRLSSQKREGLSARENRVLLLLFFHELLER